MKPAWYIKTISISLILFVQSFILSNLIFAYVKTQNYFSLDLYYSIKVVLLMLLLLVTFSLTVGVWGKYIQYLVVPLPISLAILLATIKYNYSYSFLAFLVTFMLLALDTYKSHQLATQLIKFDPKTILRFSTKGLLFIFSVLGGVLVIINSSYAKTELNIGKKIAEVAGEPIKNAVYSQLQDTLDKELAPLGVSGLSGLDVKTQDILTQLGIENLVEKDKPLSDLVNTSNLQIDVNSIIEKQVNNLLSPYKQFIHPILAILVFGVFQLYSLIAYFIYMLIIDLVFLLAKKTGLLHQEKIMVEKEVLKF